MLINVYHHIADPEGFAKQAEEAIANIPEGLTLHLFTPDADRPEAMCLWEADTLEAVRDYLDPVLEGAAVQEYHPVAAENGFGLPE